MKPDVARARIDPIRRAEAMSTAADVVSLRDARERAVAAVRAQLVSSGQSVDRASVLSVVRSSSPLLPVEVASTVADDVLAEVQGFGVLAPLLADPAVSDVLVNGPGPVWIERNGRLERTDVTIDSDRDVLRLIERALAPLGLRVDASAPWVDARLPDGSRLHASIPPIAVDGPCLAIRRFTTSESTLDDLTDSLSAELLRAAVRRRRTIVVSGATGSGKTTLLNALAGEIGADERVVTIEDTAELRLPVPNLVRLEARPGNADGVGEVTIRDLVRNALRLRPDRIVVGECRGAEAFDMLQAINTGHLGSMTTCHANTPIDAIDRLESMALLAGVGVPREVIRNQLHRAIDLVVHLARRADGTREIGAIITVGDHGAVACR